MKFCYTLFKTLHSGYSGKSLFLVSCGKLPYSFSRYRYPNLGVMPLWPQQCILASRWI